MYKYVKPAAPNFFHGEMLDAFLRIGWFRMRNEMFTTDSIMIDQGEMDVYWMRMNLARFDFSTKQLKIMNRIESVYSVQVAETARINEEAEEVFLKYKASKAFDIANSAFDTLYGRASSSNVFDSRMITVKDGGKLIAFGVFDEGLHSAAGIMNIYDPAYEKLSLGKFLVLKKIEYCITKHKKYFYPGYVTMVESRFNYKLDICPVASEIWDTANTQWVPWFSWEVTG